MIADEPRRDDDVFTLPAREGPRPQTTRATPHSQLDQNSSPEIMDQLANWAFALPRVQEEPSGISVPGARALVLEASAEANNSAFMVGREFAHIHPQPLGGSLHLKLAPSDAERVIQKGWGENHPLVDAGMLSPGTLMVYAPRDEDDLAVVQRIIVRSCEYAQNRD